MQLTITFDKCILLKFILTVQLVFVYIVIILFAKHAMKHATNVLPLHVIRHILQGESVKKYTAFKQSCPEKQYRSTHIFIKSISFHFIK